MFDLNPTAVFNGYVISLPNFLKKCSYAYWATEALFTLQSLPYRHVMRVADISAPLWGYTLDEYPLDLGLMFVIGTLYRTFAYFLMIWLHRDRQR